MKILQINKYHFRNGGTETVYFNTTNLLRKYGHEVIHFSLKNPRNLPSSMANYFIDMPELRRTGLKNKLKYSTSFLYNQESAQNIEKLIIAEKPDIAHIHLLFNGVSLSILPILSKYKIPVIYTVHDYRLLCPASLFLNGNGDICEACRGGKYYNCTLKRCSQGSILNSLMLTVEGYFKDKFFPIGKYVDTFIFVSSFSQKKHISFNKDFQFKSVLLYNFTVKNENIAYVKGDYFLYLGRLSREKGISTLISAAQQLPHVKFKIAGNGPLIKEVQHISKNIEYVGFQSGESLKRLINNSNFVIIPSVCYENNPLAIIEAFALGKPVIGANIGGIPELIINGQNGFLFEPGNISDLKYKIMKALELNNSEYQKFSHDSYLFSCNYLSPELYYEALMKIYNKAIQCKST